MVKPLEVVALPRLLALSLIIQLLLCGSLAKANPCFERRCFSTSSRLRWLTLDGPSGLATSPRKGVAVIAVGTESRDAAWPVAQSVYEDKGLRPNLSNDEARVLAGDDGPSGSKKLKELEELRSKIQGTDAASKTLLRELAKVTSTRLVVLVFSKPLVFARVYDAANEELAASEHKPSEQGAWSSLLLTLRGQLVAPVSEEKNSSQRSISKPFWKSPWFWIAAGATLAAGVGVIIATQTGKDDTARSVRLEWK